TPSGAAHARFSVAVNRSVKRGEKWESEASFFEADAWGSTAEWASKKLAKGSLCVIVGELRQERWEKNGEKFSRVTINASSVQPLGGESNGKAMESQPKQSLSDTGGNFEDDIPF
ncbi:MAG: single-stranded DNA-binding protein, partial [Spirochaetales bacterium]|nr:single-stranded DNA-binding protein [Spirochaetales bacterium]